jgi:N-acetylneuraminate lyase
MGKFGGIYTALVTPFKPNGDINEASLRKLVSANVAKGVDGFYVCGSTSEAFLMTAGERKRVLETVMRENGGRAKIICHVGAMSTKEALELARHAGKCGADAVSSIPPFYYKYTIDELIGYYMEVAGAAELPAFIYNFPAFSGVSLGVGDFARLLADRRFAGIKHTSYDLYQMERIKRLRDGLVVFSGHDEVYAGAAALGADGAIGSTFNIIAEAFVKMRRLILNSEMEKAAELQTKANDFIAVLIKHGVFQSIKHILTAAGIDAGPCRKPFLPLGEAAGKELEAAYAEYLRQDWTMPAQ